VQKVRAQLLEEGLRDGGGISKGRERGSGRSGRVGSTLGRDGVESGSLRGRERWGGRRRDRAKQGSKEEGREVTGPSRNRGSVHFGGREGGRGKEERGVVFGEGRAGHGGGSNAGAARGEGGGATTRGRAAAGGADSGAGAASSRGMG
jgi:hypothetical protein